MTRHRLKLTSDTNSTSITPASHFSHQLDRLIRALKISPRTLPHTPGTITIQKGNIIPVQQIHEVWRYGGVLVESNQILQWLVSAVDCVEKEFP